MCYDSFDRSEPARPTQRVPTPESRLAVDTTGAIDAVNVHINSGLMEFQHAMEQRMMILQAQLNTTLLSLEQRVIVLINHCISPPSDLEDMFNKY